MKYLTVPGFANSGPQHWQTAWENSLKGNFSRVEQKNWNDPTRTDWVSALAYHIQSLTEPTILVAHSLGCITVAHWAKENFSPLVKGAFLVAPADVERSSHECFQSFCPVPLDGFLFPSMVVASTNDPYARIDKVATWSAYWGSRFICVGDKGHINANSNLGIWEEGLSFLKQLKTTAERDYFNEVRKNKPAA